MGVPCGVKRLENHQKVSAQIAKARDFKFKRMRIGRVFRNGLISNTRAIRVHPARSNAFIDGVFECQMRAYVWENPFCIMAGKSPAACGVPLPMVSGIPIPAPWGGVLYSCLGMTPR